MSLRQLQSEMLRAVIDGDEGGALPVVAQPDFTRRERIAIYHDDWWLRLLRHFENVYPDTSAEAGSELFSQIVREFLAANPPHSYQIMVTSRGFADFLSARGCDTRICELAAREWQELQVEAAPWAREWSEAELAHLDEDALASLRFFVEPAFAAGRVAGVPWLLTRPTEDVEEENLTEEKFDFLSWLREYAEVSIAEIAARGGDAFLTDCLADKILTPILKPARK